MITAAAAASATPAAVGPAVLVALAIIGIWRYANPSRKDAKGTIPGRLLALVLFIVVCWVLLAVAHPSAATTAASGAASGVGTLLSAIAKLL